MIERSTSGLVLKISEYGESDKLVTLYCSDLGRITAIAKGARKSIRRFVNKLEPFTLLQAFYRPPRDPSGLYFLNDAELLDAHLTLRQDFRRYAAASYLGELLLRFTRESDPDPRLSAVLLWAFSSLHQGKPLIKILVFAHLHLLAAAGYRPELNRCCRCLQPIHPSRTYLLQSSNGSLLCTACHRGPSRSPRLSVQTLRVLASAQSAPLNRLDRLRPASHVLQEALAALYHFSVQLLQQDIHAWPALKPLQVLTS